MERNIIHFLLCTRQCTFFKVRVYYFYNLKTIKHVFMNPHTYQCSLPRTGGGRDMTKNKAGDVARWLSAARTLVQSLALKKQNKQKRPAAGCWCSCL
jgi:hypothetical protein